MQKTYVTKFNTRSLKKKKKPLSELSVQKKELPR